MPGVIVKKDSSAAVAQQPHGQFLPSLLYKSGPNPSDMGRRGCVLSADLQVFGSFSLQVWALALQVLYFFFGVATPTASTSNVIGSLAGQFSAGLSFRLGHC